MFDKYRLTQYILSVIRSFRHRGIKRFYERDDRSLIRPDLHDRVEAMLAQLGEKTTMPMKNPPHLGKVVRVSCLEPLGLNVTEGAKVLGVSRRALSNMVLGLAMPLHSTINPKRFIQRRPTFSSHLEKQIQESPNNEQPQQGREARVMSYDYEGHLKKLREQYMRSFPRQKGQDCKAADQQSMSRSQSDRHIRVGD